MKVRGKVAIVTGAGAGIGSAVALRLAHEGARVVVADIDEGGGSGTVREIGAEGGGRRSSAPTWHPRPTCAAWSPSPRRSSVVSTSW
jgi:NAD(P)-dependent dehydrogenase (short-subunit alcohol dehydrogenase family)